MEILLIRPDSARIVVPLFIYCNAVGSLKIFSLKFSLNCYKTLSESQMTVEKKMM